MEKYWAAPAVCWVPLPTRAPPKVGASRTYGGDGGFLLPCGTVTHSPCWSEQIQVLEPNLLRGAKRGMVQGTACSPTPKHMHQARRWAQGLREGGLRFPPLSPAALFTQGGSFPSLRVMQRQPLM